MTERGIFNFAYNRMNVSLHNFNRDAVLYFSLGGYKPGCNNMTWGVSGVTYVNNTGFIRKETSIRDAARTITQDCRFSRTTSLRSTEEIAATVSTGSLSRVKNSKNDALYLSAHWLKRRRDGRVRRQLIKRRQITIELVQQIWRGELNTTSKLELPIQDSSA